MHKRTLLLVDDEPDFHRILPRLLEPEGYKVFSAYTAEEALRLLEARVCDIALVDWNMPGMSGIEFCRKVRTDRRLDRMLLVMLTVRNQPEEELQGLKEGQADLYLAKPISPSELLIRLEALFNLKERAKAR